MIFERLRRVLEALEKVVIFVDEADTQFGGVGAETHSTERRLTGKIQAMMSDPRLRGRVIWLLMTARIHLLSPDIRRPGRVGDLIIPVLDPEGNILVVGQTESRDLPVTADALQPKHGGGRSDGWLAVFSPDGSGLLYCTYLGGSGGDMVRSVAELVAWISSVMTLVPGDVILTGTPAGVGPLANGDTVTVTIEGIGTLDNIVSDSGVFA